MPWPRRWRRPPAEALENAYLYAEIQRELNERKRVERLKDEFIATVSHELRTPLTSIRGALGLIVGGVTGDLPAQTMAHDRDRPDQ